MRVFFCSINRGGGVNFCSINRGGGCVLGPIRLQFGSDSAITRSDPALSVDLGPILTLSASNPQACVNGWNLGFIYRGLNGPWS